MSLSSRCAAVLGAWPAGLAGSSPARIASSHLLTGLRDSFAVPNSTSSSDREHLTTPWSCSGRVRHTHAGTVGSAAHVVGGGRRARRWASGPDRVVGASSVGGSGTPSGGRSAEGWGLGGPASRGRGVAAGSGGTGLGGDGFGRRFGGTGLGGDGLGSRVGAGFGGTGLGGDGLRGGSGDAGTHGGTVQARTCRTRGTTSAAAGSGGIPAADARTVPGHRRTNYRGTCCTGRSTGGLP